MSETTTPKPSQEVVEAIQNLFAKQDRLAKIKSQIEALTVESVEIENELAAYGIGKKTKSASTTPGALKTILTEADIARVKKLAGKEGKTFGELGKELSANHLHVKKFASTHTAHFTIKDKKVHAK